MDIGCCESSLVVELQKLGFNVYGIDLRNCNRFKNFYRQDARKLSFPDNSFDICCAISTIEHIGLVQSPYHTDTQLDAEGDKKSVREMLRVTKPNGIVVITLPYGKGDEHLSKWVRFYNKERIQDLLPKNLIAKKVKFSIRTKSGWVKTDERTASLSSSCRDSKTRINRVTGNICIMGTKNE